MAKLAFRGLVFASFVMAAAACGGDDGGDGLVFVDGGGGDGGGGATCNPVSQQGCAAGEKCASVTVQQNPTIVQTLCVPDGTVAEGGECATGEPGPSTGFDNCVGGNECVFGECRPVCRQQGSTVAGTCAEGGVCQIFNDLFEDLDTDDVGICIPQCDPVDGLAHDGTDPVFDYADDCGAETGLACFMNLFDGIGVCSGAFEGAPSNGEECPDRNGDGEPDCALNGCAPAHGPLLPAGSLTEWQGEFVFFANSIFGLADVCIQYCDVSLTEWGGAEEAPVNSPCPPTYECRYVTGLYLNFDNPTFAPDNFGLCVPTMQLGTCNDNALGDIGAYLIPEGSTEGTIPGDNNFIPGCNTGEEVLTKANFCAGTEGATDVPEGTYGDSECADPAIAGVTSLGDDSKKKGKLTLPKTKAIPTHLLPDFEQFYSSQLPQ